MTGHFVVIDAIDGAGKSTAIKAIASFLEGKGLKTVSATEEMKRTGRVPEASDPTIAAADVLLCAEPTYAWIGAAIREEMILKHAERSYNGRITAEAYALDRAVLFSRLVLPFLAAHPNGWVVQDRGAITSFAYQPLQDPTISLDWLQNLEGNKIEMSRPPELLLLLRITPEEAMRRVDVRQTDGEKQIFEQTSFQEELALRYRDPEVLAPYQNAGTKIVEIDASQSPEAVAHDICAELTKLL